jgi:O-antigen/teichoic acid export membrane protein
LSRQAFKNDLLTIVSGIFMVVVGHLGAVMGALLVGTAGVLLCYIAGFWSIALGIKRLVNKTHTTSN